MFMFSHSVQTSLPTLPTYCLSLIRRHSDHTKADGGAPDSENVVRTLSGLRIAVSPGRFLEEVGRGDLSGSPVACDLSLQIYRGERKR